MLRTTFRTVDGEPVQVIDPPASRCRWPLVDLSGAPDVGEAPRLLAAAEAARAPFDLAARAARSAAG